MSCESKPASDGNIRILMVSEDVPYASMGGLAKHALNLARALGRAGHQVDFLGGDQNPIEVAGDEGRFGGRFYGALNGHLSGWKERRLGFYNPVKRSWLARRFARIIARHAAGYDVVHYHGHVPNLARYLPPGINFVQTRHDQGSDCLQHTRFRDGDACTAVDPEACATCISDKPNALQRKLSALAVRRYRREVAESFRAHPVIFVSDMLQCGFSRSMGVERWGEVAHNFIDTDALAKAAEQPIRKVPHETTEIVVCGKIYPPKGIASLVEQFASRCPDNMTLIVVGEGPQLGELQTKFASPRVHFLGWLTPIETLKVVAGADAVVVPSLWEEAFGLTSYEALLLAKPLYALNRGATPELEQYCSYPGQLRLFENLPDLVDTLVKTSKPFPDTDAKAAISKAIDAREAVAMLLPIYRRQAR